MNKSSKLKKKENTYEVTVGGKTYEISPLFVMKYNLHEDRKLSLDELANLINDELIEKYSVLAQKQLSKMMTIYELKEYLKNKEAPEFVVAEVVKKMKKLNLLNDQLYIENYIDTHPNYGPNKLVQKLREKGANFNLIEEIVYSRNYYENLLKLIQKRIKRPGKNNKKQLQDKTLNYIINAGFDKEEAINLIVREVNKKSFDNDELITNYINKMYSGYEIKYGANKAEIKIYNYLLSRGFETEDIKRAILKYQEDR